MKSYFKTEQEANDYKVEHQLHGRVPELIRGSGKWALNFPLEAHVTVRQPHEVLDSAANTERPRG